MTENENKDPYRGLSLARETGESNSSSSAADRHLDSDEEDSKARRRSTDPLLGNEERPILQLPEALSHLSTEERRALEAKLKRKIDARLMPALIVMYILNYIDR